MKHLCDNCIHLFVAKGTTMSAKKCLLLGSNPTITVNECTHFKKKGKKDA